MTVELAIVRDLTQSLRQIYLPSTPPEVPGYELAWCYSPASEEEGVSGDCLDAIYYDEMLNFIVGDVCGKGLYAAKNSVLVCNMWRGITSCEVHPTFVLTALNRAVARYFGEDQFVTMVAGCLHTPSGLFSIASAGHPPGILKQSGKCRLLEQGDVALGIGDELIPSSKKERSGRLKKVKFGAKEHYLRPGDELLLYTDGITEASNGYELYGEVRLRELFEQCNISNPHETLQTLFTGIKAWANRDLRDDVAMFLLKRSQ